MIIGNEHYVVTFAFQNQINMIVTVVRRGTAGGADIAGLLFTHRNDFPLSFITMIVSFCLCLRYIGNGNPSGL